MNRNITDKACYYIYGAALCIKLVALGALFILLAPVWLPIWLLDKLTKVIVERAELYEAKKHKQDVYKATAGDYDD